MTGKHCLHADATEFRTEPAKVDIGRRPLCGEDSEWEYFRTLDAARSTDRLHHPDDGHGHSLGCRRCGVDTLDAAQPDTRLPDWLTPERLAEAMRRSEAVPLGYGLADTAARILASLGDPKREGEPQ